LIATAVSFAILPILSTHAATEVNGYNHPFRQTLAQGLRLIIVLIIPATIGMFVLARPIVALLFEHGSFTSYDTAMTSLALRLYLFGLPFNALDLLLVFAFYARQNTLTPALIGASLTAVYIVLAVILLPVIGFFSIMVADSIRIGLHTIISAWILWRLLGGGFDKVVWVLVRVFLLAGLMGGIMLIALQGMGLTLAGTTGFCSEVLLVFVPGLIGGAVYLIGIWISGIEELNTLWGLARKRLSGNL
jgi:putative peptidoglycan lipid II flippase